ncbi:hypothetical protein Hanom_Chr17g01545591 [Helianthus anomalus]
MKKAICATVTTYVHPLKRKVQATKYKTYGNGFLGVIVTGLHVPEYKLSIEKQHIKLSNQITSSQHKFINTKCH